jgi:hypothetical protein
MTVAAKCGHEAKHILATIYGVGEIKQEVRRRRNEKRRYTKIEDMR